MLKISVIVALGALVSGSVPLTLPPADRDGIMRALLVHLAGEQNFGHHRPAGRRSCVARNLIPFQDSETAMADDQVVSELNVMDAPAEPASSEPAPSSEGLVDSAWLRPTQMLADADGSCGSPAADIISLSPPKLDTPDKARIYFSLVCGGLCGTGEVLTLERKDGAWRVTGREQLWVS